MKLPMSTGCWPVLGDLHMHDGCLWTSSYLCFYSTVNLTEPHRAQRRLVHSLYLSSVFVFLFSFKSHSPRCWWETLLVSLSSLLSCNWTRMWSETGLNEVVLGVGGNERYLSLYLYKPSKPSLRECMLGSCNCSCNSWYCPLVRWRKWGYGERLATFTC